MPFLVVVADHNKDELFRGPTFFGDRNLAPEIVADLDGTPSRNEDDDSGDIQPFYETSKSSGQVLNILENLGFRVVATSSAARGQPATFVWTLHKKLPGEEDDDMNASTISADSVDNEPSKFSVQFMELRDIQDHLNALSTADGLQTKRLTTLVAELEKTQALHRKRTACTDGASQMVDECLSQLGSDRAMTTEKADSLVLVAKSLARSAKFPNAEDETETKVAKLFKEFQAEKVYHFPH